MVHLRHRALDVARLTCAVEVTPVEMVLRVMSTMTRSSMPNNPEHLRCGAEPTTGHQTAKRQLMTKQVLVLTLPELSGRLSAKEAALPPSLAVRPHLNQIRSRPDIRNTSVSQKMRGLSAAKLPIALSRNKRCPGFMQEDLRPCGIQGLTTWRYFVRCGQVQQASGWRWRARESE